VTERLGIRRKQLPNVLKEKRGSCKLKKQTLDCSVWRTCFGSAYGPSVRQAIG
jgi:hypothetical protein